MYISAKSIVSNSDMIKNYKSCREKAESFGKIFVLKFNQPDAVLFSIREYEKLSESIEQADHLKEKEIAEINEGLLKQARTEVDKSEIEK